MPAEPKANPSLFSGVFKFVSREIDNFVVKAIGSAPPEPDVFSEEEDEEFDDKEHVFVHEDHLERHDTRSPPKKRTKTGSHPIPPTAGVKHIQYDSSTLSKKNRPGHREEHVVPGNGAGSRLPSPPPLPRALKRRPSISMPGSLFPRSPSMEPEHSPTIDREQRVRFASTIPDSPHLHSSPRISKPQPAVPSSPPSTPRHRKQFDPTVQAAVGRFQEDADPSILLPKMQTSPHQYSGVDKGKGTAIEVTSIEDGDTSGILRVRGKEKELVAVREDLNKNERRLERTDEAESSFLEQIKQDRDRDKEKIRMLEGEIERLKKELMRQSASEANLLPPPPPPPPPQTRSMISLPNTFSNPTLFASARASLRHAPTPVENPINPVLASRRTGMPTVGISPDKMVAFLKEMKTVRLRKVSASEKRSTSLGSGSSFASTPNMSMGEANPSSSSLFRRSFSSLNRVTDASWSSRHAAAAGNHSMSEIETRRGEKRKRAITGSQEELPPPLRPLRHRSAASSAESSLTTVSNTSFVADALAGPSFSQSYPPPLGPANSTSTSWPSSSVTDAPTPSLCSDNDVERDDTSPDDQSPSTPPVTTGPSRAFFRFKGNGIPVDPERLQRRNSDATMADALPPESESTLDPKLRPNAKPTIFDKRPPTSPFPNKSPRRPRPPARKTQTTHTLPSHSTPHSPPLSDDEDPLSLTFSSPERALQASGLRRIQTRQKNEANSRTSLAPATRVPSSRTASKAPASSQFRPRQSPRHRSASLSSRSGRRLTLDEELRNAFAAAASPICPDETHVQDDEEDRSQDDCFLVGVGTRSKHRGFLPGGGAAGAPVFRGVGHVEGAIEDDEEEPRRYRRSSSRQRDNDDEYLPSFKRSTQR